MINATPFRIIPWCIFLHKIMSWCLSDGKWDGCHIKRTWLMLMTKPWSSLNDMWLWFLIYCTIYGSKSLIIKPDNKFRLQSSNNFSLTFPKKSWLGKPSQQVPVKFHPQNSVISTYCFSYICNTCSLRSWVASCRYVLAIVREDGEN